MLREHQFSSAVQEGGTLFPAPLLPNEEIPYFDDNCEKYYIYNNTNTIKT